MSPAAQELEISLLAAALAMTGAAGMKARRKLGRERHRLGRRDVVAR